MGVEDYKVKVYTPHYKYVSHPMTLLDAVEYMARVLNVIHSLDCLDRGVIPDSTCIFTGDTIYHKSYIVTVAFPYTKLVLKKQSKGSFDDEEILSTIKYVKGLYDERI